MSAQPSRLASSRIVALVLWCIVNGAAPSWGQGPNLPPGTRFIMSHFRAEGGGDERLYISVSADSLTWTTLNNGQPVWQPVNYQPFYNCVRDPSIVFSKGYYWVAFTSGNYGFHTSFGLLRSTDLINWSYRGEISTALPGGASSPYTWGPYFFKDGDGSVHLFVALGPNGFASLRSYELHPLDDDMTLWSAPVAVDLPPVNGRVFTNEFWVWREGDVYHGIYVDFMDNGAYIHVTSDNLLTGWTNRQRLGFDSMEGGFMLKRPEGGYRFLVENHLGYHRVDFPDSTFALPNPLFASDPVQQVPMRNGKPIAALETTSYADWAALMNVPPATPLADSDDDGLADFAEFGLGLAPRTPNAPAEKVWRDAAGKLHFQATRLPASQGAAVRLQSAAHLPGWQEASGVMELRSSTLMSDGRELLEWRERLPSDKLFLRLQIGSQ